MIVQVQFDTLIVGGGHAGAQAAIALRQLGYAGSIAIAGRESELPYERPPLSKEYLSGEKPWDRMLIRPPAFWDERAITMLGGTEIVTVAAAERQVTTASGQHIAYTNLVWAAGGDARRLSCPGAELAGVHTVRNRADADAMMTGLGAVQRVVVIGGGYIGLEAAAVLRKLGKHVTLGRGPSHQHSHRPADRIAGPRDRRYPVRWGVAASRYGGRWHRHYPVRRAVDCSRCG